MHMSWLYLELIDKHNPGLLKSVDVHTIEMTLKLRTYHKKEAIGIELVSCEVLPHFTADIQLVKIVRERKH